jgi:hypothetical protein
MVTLLFTTELNVAINSVKICNVVLNYLEETHQMFYTFRYPFVVVDVRVDGVRLCL